jgi:hypothetical protein
MVFAWLWHPGSSGYEPTLLSASSFSTMTAYFKFVIPSYSNNEVSIKASLELIKDVWAIFFAHSKSELFLWLNSKASDFARDAKGDLEEV